MEMVVDEDMDNEVYKKSTTKWEDVWLTAGHWEVDKKVDGEVDLSTSFSLISYGEENEEEEEVCDWQPGYLAPVVIITKGLGRDRSLSNNWVTLAVSVQLGAMQYRRLKVQIQKCKHCRKFITRFIMFGIAKSNIISLILD